MAEEKTNQGEVQETVEVSSSDLEKASQEIDTILKAVDPQSVQEEKQEDDINTEKIAANPNEHMFEDPQSALMEEEVIQKASEPLVAMAAFMAEAVEGIQKAVETINNKVDEHIKLTARGQDTIVKSLSSNLDLIKSFGSQPAQDFKTSEPQVGEVLEKSQKEASKNEGPTAEFVEGWMEKAVKAGELNAVEVAKYETSKVLPDSVKGKLIAEWNSTKNA